MVGAKPLEQNGYKVPLRQGDRVRGARAAAVETAGSPRAARPRAPPSSAAGAHHQDLPGDSGRIDIRRPEELSSGRRHRRDFDVHLG